MKFLKNNDIKFNEKIIEGLSEKFGLDNDIIKLLFSRGFDNEQKIEDFLEPKISNLYNPFLLKNMREAVDKIESYIKNDKKIRGNALYYTIVAFIMCLGISFAISILIDYQILHILDVLSSDAVTTIAPAPSPKSIEQDLSDQSKSLELLSVATSKIFLYIPDAI